jgi:transcriptional regulator with XRE-family HTH domain
MIDRTRLKKRLKRLGLTQKALAARIGLSQPALSQKLGGKRPLTLAQAERIAAALQIGPEDFGRFFFG